MQQSPFSAQSINHDAIIDMINIVSKDKIIIMPTTNSAYGSGDRIITAMKIRL